MDQRKLVPLEAAWTLLGVGGMTVDVKVILRNGLIGFALGVVVMLGISYGASTLGSSPPAAPASAR